MSRYLLDTSTCSRIMGDGPQVVAHLISLLPDDSVFTCPIVRGEILFGVMRLPEGRRKRELEQKASGLFVVVPCEPMPESVGDHYASIKRTAQTQGTPLDENDLWIAATALALDAILVSADSDFARVERLRVVDWMNRNDMESLP